MPTPNRKLSIFLCHASQDKPILRELYKRLLAEGWIDPWLDEEKLLPGQDWDMEIEKAVEDADVVIVCLTKNSVSKEGYIQKELKYALNIALMKPEETIFILPLRFEDCPVPRSLRSIQYTDFFPEKRIDWAYGKLFDSLDKRARNLGVEIIEKKVLEVDFAKSRILKNLSINQSTSLKAGAACQSDRGRVNSKNSDFVSFFEPRDPQELKELGSLYVVADGGRSDFRGERASQFAAEKVLYEYYQPSDHGPRERLIRSLLVANQNIFEYAESNNEKISCAIVAAVVWNNLLIVANIGNCRAYLIMSDDVIQITRDHTTLYDILLDNEADTKEININVVEDQLTRKLGAASTAAFDVFPEIVLRPTYKLLLCTDGFTRYATRKIIHDLASSGSPKDIVEKLISFSNTRGGQDNATVAVVFPHIN